MKFEESVIASQFAAIYLQAIGIVFPGIWTIRPSSLIGSLSQTYPLAECLIRVATSSICYIFHDTSSYTFEINLHLAA